MASWSDLLPELVFEIAKGLNFYEDFISFSNVCSSWRSAIGEEEPAGLPFRFPSMLVVDDEEDECEIHLWGGNVRKIQLPMRETLCWSSTGGWLLIIQHWQTDPMLFHPSSGRRIRLPNLECLPLVVRLPDDEPKEGYHPNLAFINKVFVSFSEQKQDEFVVLIIFGSRGSLAFFRAGDSSWTHVERGFRCRIEDLCYYNGKVYTFHGNGWIFSCDVNSKTPTFLPVSNRPLTALFEDDFTNVEWDHILTWDNNKLLVIHHQTYLIIDGHIYSSGEVPPPEDLDHLDDAEYIQYMTRSVCMTKSFGVFECDLETGEWSRVEDLGNRSIFVGESSSFYIKASYCIKPNCIYFTDNRNETNKDVGIYHMLDESIEPHFDMPSRGVENKQMWIAPPTL